MLDLHLDRTGLEAPDVDPVLEVVAELVRHSDDEPSNCSGIKLVVVKLKSTRNYTKSDSGTALTKYLIIWIVSQSSITKYDES